MQRIINGIYKDIRSGKFTVEILGECRNIDNGKIMVLYVSNSDDVMDQLLVMSKNIFLRKYKLIKES